MGGGRSHFRAISTGGTINTPSVPSTNGLAESSLSQKEQQKWVQSGVDDKFRGVKQEGGQGGGGGGHVLFILTKQSVGTRLQRIMGEAEEEKTEMRERPPARRYR